MTNSEIYLPVNVKQVVEMIRQMPIEQKEEILGALLEKDLVPEEHKEIVRRRIKKYKRKPSALIDEETAWKLIDDES